MAHDDRGWEGCPKCGYMGGMGGWRFVKWDTGEDAHEASRIIHALREANKRLNRTIVQLRAENEALRPAHRTLAQSFQPVQVEND